MYGGKLVGREDSAFAEDPDLENSLFIGLVWSCKARWARRGQQSIRKHRAHPVPDTHCINHIQASDTVEGTAWEP